MSPSSSALCEKKKKEKKNWWEKRELHRNQMYSRYSGGMVALPPLLFAGIRIYRKDSGHPFLGSLETRYIHALQKLYARW